MVDVINSCFYFDLLLHTAGGFQSNFNRSLHAAGRFRSNFDWSLHSAGSFQSDFPFFGCDLLFQQLP